MRVSTLTVLLVLCATLLFAACATVGPPQPPSLELPTPPSDLRAVRKGDHVTLAWTIPALTTDRQRVRSLGPTRICRGVEPELTQCGTPVGEAAPPPAAGKPPAQKAAGSYADALPHPAETGIPSGFVTYAVEVLNAGGRGAGLSNQVRVSLAYTLPPPQDFTARVTSQGVVLSWTGEVPPPTAQSWNFIYRVYRVQEGGQQRIPVGEVPAREGSLTLTDASMEWEKTYAYSVAAVTVIAPENHRELQVEGEDSPEIRVFADDVFPPAVPSGLQAVFSGPGQQAFIDLIWAPVTDVDLDGYNVYRHEEGEAPARVNQQLLKTPAYRDANVVSGGSYFYSVSAVDVRGNESARSEEASEKVP